jgi:cyclase
MVEFLDMIIDVRDQVRTLISQGRNLDEVMAARPTAAYDAQWGQEASWTANDFVPIVFYDQGGGSLFQR